MVESEQRVRKFRRLLEEEKTSNGKLLTARLNEIGKLKEDIKNLEKENYDFKKANEILKTTLGHF